MIVYIYNKKDNTKIATVKNCVSVFSDKEEFLIIAEGGTKTINKKGIKLVVYGF